MFHQAGVLAGVHPGPALYRAGDVGVWSSVAAAVAAGDVEQMEGSAA